MPFLTYTLWRLGLLLAVVGVLWLVGVRHWVPLMGFGVVIAAALSYLFLQRQRDATTAWLAARAEARRRTVGADEEVEDAAVEQAGSPQGEASPGEEAGRA